MGSPSPQAAVEKGLELRWGGRLLGRGMLEKAAAFPH